MAVIFVSDEAREDLTGIDKSVRPLFVKHMVKMEHAPPRRFLHGGAGLAVEDVGQGRIVCRVEGEAVSVLRLFATHKEYENWYRKRSWR